MGMIDDSEYSALNVAHAATMRFGLARCAAVRRNSASIAKPPTR